jgi:hypothetical protein
MCVPFQGCEYHGYNSDITRTWPVNGRFTQSQRDLYEAVLSVQTELIRMCATLPSLDSLFHAMCSLLGLRLQELGVLSSRSSHDDLSRVSTQLSHKPAPSHLECNKFSDIGGYHVSSKVHHSFHNARNVMCSENYTPDAFKKDVRYLKGNLVIQPFLRNLVIAVGVLCLMCLSVCL